MTTKEAYVARLVRKERLSRYAAYVNPKVQEIADKQATLFAQLDLLDARLEAIYKASLITGQD